MKLTRPLAFVDFETTGTNPAQDRIVQWGLVRRDPDGTTALFEGLVNPGVPIPAEATAVHGITAEMVRDAEPTKVALARLLGELRGCDLAGYNLFGFDLPLLQAELARHGMPTALGDRRVVDVMQVYFRQQPRTLAAAVKHYTSKELVGAHGALVDAGASATVLEAMLNSHNLPDDVEGLQALSKPEGAVDLQGKFIEVNGALVVNFGKHKGTSAAKVDRSFFEWMLRQDFAADTKAIARKVLLDAH